MSISISSKKESVYVLVSERDLPEHEQTKFFISAPSMRDEMFIRDELYRGSVINDRGNLVFGRTVNLQAAKAFELLVRKIEGLKDEDGKALKCEGSEVFEIMSKLHSDVVWEVGRHIVESIELKNDSVKN